MQTATLGKFFVPRASVSFYRMEYQILNDALPTSLAQLAALLPRASLVSWQALVEGGNLDVSFDGVPGGWFAYRCLPSLVASLTPPRLLNLTCSMVGGSSGTMPATELGTVHIAILRADATSATLWGCFMGEQNWHVISTHPTLSDQQAAANDALLSDYGFDMANAMNMNYPPE